MGGGKRKFNSNIRFRKFHKKDVAIVVEEKKAPPKEEDVKSLLDMWMQKKKEPKHDEQH